MAYLPISERAILCRANLLRFYAIFISVGANTGDSFHTQHFQLLCMSVCYAVTALLYCRKYCRKWILPEIGVVAVIAAI
ncbi:hypothetical protein DES37_108223 [Mangrovibacter plantisponsor]|uniref:Uncharacterized protein n=1 Tax=Mangrovibacter plantisponsor TaxID=451513 RepID=A0A317PXF2_9ENTR|nr:hypothetical protein DES37_108223 [Mangrovibacter plantisponsor]